MAYRVLNFVIVAVLSVSSNTPIRAYPTNQPNYALQLEQRCGDCHYEGSREGNFDLTDVIESGLNPATNKSFKRALDIISAGRMPPADYGVTSEEVEELVHSLESYIRGQKTINGSISSESRLLTPHEYDRCLQEITGIDRQMLLLPFTPLAKTRNPDGTLKVDLSSIAMPEAQKPLLRIAVPGGSKGASGFTNDAASQTFGLQHLNSYSRIANQLVEEPTVIRRSKQIRSLLKPPLQLTWLSIALMILTAVLLASTVSSGKRAVTTAIIVLGCTWVAWQASALADIHLNYDCGLSLALLAVLWLKNTDLKKGTPLVTRVLLANAIILVEALALVQFNPELVFTWTIIASMAIAITSKHSPTENPLQSKFIIAASLALTGGAVLFSRLNFLISLKDDFLMDRVGVFKEWSLFLYASIAIAPILILLSVGKATKLTARLLLAATLVAALLYPEHSTFSKNFGTVLSTRTTASFAGAKLDRWLEQAFRGDANASDKTRYRSIFSTNYEINRDYRNAMASTISATLVSPKFLFRGNEFEPAVKAANQISFFLTGGPPSDELIAICGLDESQAKERVRGYIQGVLSSGRSDEFVEIFGRQWLELGRVLSAIPDPEVYPHFYASDDGDDSLDPRLAPLFYGECVLLIQNLVTENRPVSDLFLHTKRHLNSDLLGVYNPTEHSNPRVEKEEDHWQFTDLESNRQGILSMGGPLTLTSFPNRTSPVRRGVWTLKALYNREPPEPDIAAQFTNNDSVNPTQSMRERLAFHADQASCSSCHRVIDPVGFALESFNAIGEKRVVDEFQNPVRENGVMPDGSTFQTYEEFLSLLSKDNTKIARGIVEHLLAYSLGRSLETEDWITVSDILSKNEESGYRLGAIIEEIAISTVFLKNDQEQTSDAN